MSSALAGAPLQAGTKSEAAKVKELSLEAKLAHEQAQNAILKEKLKEEQLEAAKAQLARGDGAAAALRLPLRLLLRALLALLDVRVQLVVHRVAAPRVRVRKQQPLARLAGRHAGVLQLTMGMVDKARRIEPQKAEYAAEYAYQQMMLGNLDGAAQTLRMAGTLEEGSDRKSVV